MKKICILLVLVLGTVLRCFNIENNPPSLNWDEASLGYNAYTILTSGRDEHGELLPISRFIAFGDYKPPGYIYAAVVPIGVFGLSELAVRLPSIIAGLLLVISTYALTKELFGRNKTALVSMAIMAISPWGVHFSRGAFEANLAAALNALAVFFFLKVRERGFFLALSIIFFVLSFYTFNANRIIAPLLLILLSLYYWQEVLKNWKWLIAGILVASFMVLPSIGYLSDRESKVRFQEVSIFNNLDTVVTSNQRIAREGGNPFAKVMHNRRILYGLDFLKHATENLNFRFLFTHGDGNPRLSVGNMGLLYVYEIPLLMIGVVWILKKKKKQALILLSWVAIVLIPAGTAKETPHALRIISTLPVFQIIAAVGLMALLDWGRKRYSSWKINSLIGLYVLLVAATMLYFLHSYFIHYPIQWAGEWQYGYKQMVEFINQNKKEYDKVYVTIDYGRPYIYFAFYTPYEATDFLKQKKAERDWFGFWTVNSLGNIHFGIPEPQNIDEDSLIVQSGSGQLPGNATKVKEIYGLDGSIMFQIGALK